MPSAEHRSFSRCLATDLTISEDSLAREGALHVVLTVADLEATAETNVAETALGVQQLSTRHPPQIDQIVQSGPISELTSAVGSMESALKHLDAFMKVANLLAEVRVFVLESQNSYFSFKGPSDPSYCQGSVGSGLCSIQGRPCPDRSGR